MLGAAAGGEGRKAPGSVETHRCPPAARVSTLRPPRLPGALSIPRPRPGAARFGLGERSPWLRRRRRRLRRLQGGAGRLGGWEAGDARGLCSTFLNKLSNRRGCCCCTFYVKLKVSHARVKPAF